MAKKQLKTAPEVASAAPAASAKPATKSPAKTPTKSSSAAREPRVTTAKHSRGKAAKSTVESEASEALALDAVAVHAFATDPAASADPIPADLISADSISNEQTLFSAMAEIAQEHTPEVTAVSEAPAEAPVATSSQEHVDPRAAIEKLAYSYFEARGYAHGNPEEDWVRAEREYYGRN